MNNIVLVCDDKKISEEIKSNLMLLREFDFIYPSDFISAEIAVEQNTPKLIILYSNSDESNIINFIKNTKSAPIFFVTDEITDEKLLNVFEAGISDYASIKQSKTEFLVRLMACIKRSTSLSKAKLNEDVLTQIGILKKNTDFYSVKYTPAVLKNLAKTCVDSDTKACLMAIAPDIDYKNRYNLDYIATILKQNLRDDDIIGFGNGMLYVLLRNANTQGALNVYNKLKSIVSDTFTISAGVLEINKDLDLNLMVKNVEYALDDALMLKNSVVVQENISSIDAPMNWLDKSNKKHKSFKLFKKAFVKKLETVVAPVFYQKQQLAEQRLFETKVEQYTIENKCVFSLTKGGIKSVFEITYPGAIKINIDISDNINDIDEPRRLTYDLSQINEKMLGELLDKFIRNFQKLYG